MRPVSLSTNKKHVRPRCKSAVPIPVRSRGFMYRGPYQREEKPSEDDKRFALEHIAQAIEDWDWSRSAALAYCDQIYQTLLANRGWRLDKPETLYKYIEQANLPMDKGIADALSEAWGRSSYARCQS